MTLFSGHELATALATLAAMLSVLLGGQTAPWAWVSVAAIPVGLVLKRSGRTLPNAIGGALALCAVTFGVLFGLREGLSSVLLGAGYSLLMLVAVRLVNRETPAHDLQLYALSLLLVLAAAALNISWLYAPCFLLYTVSIVWGLTTRELKRAAQDDHTARAAQGAPPLWHEAGLLRGRFFLGTGLMSLVVLLGTLTLFVVFPRVGLGMLRLGNTSQKSGFADTVRLGEGGSISEDFSVAMRVRSLDDETLPTSLYFRGAAFDHYDGSTWTRSDAVRGDRRGAGHMVRGDSNLTRYRVTLDPSLVPYLFTAGRVSRVSVKPSVRVLAAPPVPFRDGLGDLVVQNIAGEPVNYDVDADISAVDFAALSEAPAEYPPEISGTYLDHEVLPRRVVELARRWAGERTRPLDRVAAISAELSAFAYTVEDQVPPLGTTPLEHFLFNRKAGHCEYFATALAMMSRAVGVPARMVGGYQGGARHPSEGYLVFRQSDAHAWAEVFVGGVGWVPVDATPGQILARPPLSTLAHLMETLQRNWEEYVVDFSLGTQLEAAQGLGAMLSRLRNWSPQGGENMGATWRAVVGAMALLSVVVALAVLWRRRQRQRPVPAHQLRRALERATVRLAGAAPPSSTVREWTLDAALRLDNARASTLQQARELFEQVRYGGRTLTAEEEERWVAQVNALQPPR